MSSAFSRRRGSGRRGPDLCRRRHGAGKGDLRRSCGAMRGTNPCRRSNWPYRFPRTLGVRSHGVKARTKNSAPASPRFASDRLIATIGVRSPMARNGSSSNGRKARRSRPNIGFQPCRRTRPSRRSSKPPNYAGGSSAIIRNSNRNSGSITTRGEVGEASTTTWRSASRHTDSWSPRGVSIPPSRPRSGALLKAPRLPQGYRPRGSPAATRTPRRQLHRHHPQLRLANILARRLLRCAPVDPGLS